MGAVQGGHLGRRAGTFWLLMTVAAMMGLVLGIIWQVVAAMPEDRRVPDVVNKPVAEAQRMVEARDLVFRIARYEYHPKVPAEYVIKMSPYPGKTVKEGREVSVIVSRGEPLVRVPLLSTMQYEEASKRLKELSLKPKKTGERPSEHVSKGGIVSQWPLAGQEVPTGSEVKLVVSSGRPSRRSHGAGQQAMKQYRVKVQLPEGDKERLVNIEVEEDGVPVDKYTRWHKRRRDDRVHALGPARQRGPGDGGW
jgi:beta-lactam-binding protein with PASTA domain